MDSYNDYDSDERVQVLYKCVRVICCDNLYNGQKLSSLGFILYTAALLVRPMSFTHGTGHMHTVHVGFDTPVHALYTCTCTCRLIFNCSYMYMNAVLYNVCRFPKGWRKWWMMSKQDMERWRTKPQNWTTIFRSVCRIGRDLEESWSHWWIG